MAPPGSGSYCWLKSGRTMALPSLRKVNWAAKLSLPASLDASPAGRTPSARARSMAFAHLSALASSTRTRTSPAKYEMSRPRTTS
eukprot:13769157-Alexandrium_andersonii.AAC.1